MAEENTNAEATDEGAEETPKKGKLVPMLLLLVGLGGGAAGGVLFVGPALASDGGASAGETHGEEGGEDDGGHGGGEEGESGHGEGEGGEPVMYDIPNLIVNPAGTNASRFLLVDLTIKLTSEEAALALEAREAEARDALIQILGRRTVDELADISTREVLKTEVQEALDELLGGSVVSLFMPRFVIQ